MRELQSLVPYVRPYRTGLALGLLCVCFANLSQIAAPYLMKLAIDGLGDPGVTSSRIAFLGSLIIVAALVGGTFRYAMRELMNGISRRVEADLRNDFFRHLLSLDATFFGTVRTGDLMSRATNDAFAVRMTVGPALMYATNTAVTFVLALAFMLWISPRLTAYAMIPMALLPVVVLVFGPVIHRRYEEIQSQFASLSTFVQDNLSGVRIVRAYAREPEQEREFDAHNADYRASNMRLVWRAGAFHPSLSLLSGAAVVIVAGFGGLEVMSGRISVGDFVAFAFYVTLLTWPLIALGWVVRLVQRGEASMGRLNAILGARSSLRASDRVVEAPPATGKIEFRNVSFSYPGADRLVLDQVSFVARPGQTVAIVGPTGAGKSTLVALLERQYDPTEGAILLDGVPLTSLDPAELRKRLGVVPQDSFLFSDTLVENIALGLVTDDVPTGDVRSTVRSAAQMAELHDQILLLPRQYDTVLGERGVNLSGGQKQRATLARALARDPEILVLDDALSAVDTHTETAILESLRAALRDRTAFVISHRVSAVMHADQILVLDEGHIVERGRHSELAASSGLYSRLSRRQLLEEDLRLASREAVAR